VPQTRRDNQIMSSSTKSTPARRLTRTSNQFQPVVKQSLESQGRYNHNWNGEPIATRPAVFQDDSDVDGDDEQNLQTHFYGSFIRKSWKNSKKDSIPDNDIFEIGDTVLVNTHSNVRFPSVGVIIAMWQTCFPPKKSGSRVSGVALEERKMKVKIHWFIRPTELPTNRAYRECKEVRLSYNFPLRSF
jgi:origin recognition complex subunit 1